MKPQIKYIHYSIQKISQSLHISQHAKVKKLCLLLRKETISCSSVSSDEASGTFFYRCESLSELLSSALKIRFECGCARLDPEYDPKTFVHNLREEKRKYLALEALDK